MVGTVKSYRKKFGYGFIQGENEEDIFFSYRTIEGHDIRPGTKIEYSDVSKGRKGLKAGKVTIIE